MDVKKFFKPKFKFSRGNVDLCEFVDIGQVVDENDYNGDDE